MTSAVSYPQYNSVLLRRASTVSEERTASVFSPEDAVHSSEALVSNYYPHGVKTQKTNIDIFTAVRTSYVSLSPWIRVLLEKLIVRSTSQEIHRQPQGSSPSSQEPATGPYLEPGESSPHAQTQFSYDPF
jgi:hypothetical protein